MDTREFVHVNGVDRQAAYEGTELCWVLAASPDWERATTQAEPVVDKPEDAPGPDEDDGLPEGVTAKPGGWFELPDGSKVRGREAVDEWAKAQEATS